MEFLNLAPGPLVGQVMRYLLEIRLEEGLLGDEEIRRRLSTWWRTRAE